MIKFSELLKTAGRRILPLTCAAFLLMPAAGADSGSSSVNKNSDNVAIEGYDTVGYFTEHKAVKGNPEFAFTWNEAQWYFSNASHRDLFAGDPERYVPQFGGFCAGAMRRGVTVKADPEAWTIVDGKLYMKVNKEFREEWRQDPVGNIKKAEDAWAALEKK